MSGLLVNQWPNRPPYLNEKYLEKNDKEEKVEEAEC